MMKPTATSETTVHPGDIVVVPFPYSDRLAEKRRPALVVSSKRFNAAGFLWVVMVTSQVDRMMTGDVKLDHESCGLPLPSLARTAKIATIEKSRVIRVAGRVDKQRLAKIKAAVMRVVMG